MCLYYNAYQAKGTHFRKEARRSSTRTGSLAPALTMFKMIVTISCHPPQKTGCSTSSIVTTQPWPWDNLTMMRMEITVDNSHCIENVIFFFQIRLYKMWLSHFMMMGYDERWYVSCVSSWGHYPRCVLVLSAAEAGGGGEDLACPPDPGRRWC